MNTLVIRADAASASGAGHVMRCLALAQAWHDKGGKVIFISRCESAALRERITAEGIDLLPLDKPHPDPFDLHFTKGILNKLQTGGAKPIPWLAVDGYHFDAGYQKSIKNAGYNLLWIDDYGHAAHYYADLVLNQNVSADPSFYDNREPYTQLLLGPRYVLLRREFARWQGWRRQIPAVARKVLVTLGGADPDNVTLKVIQALKKLELPGLEARIIIGPANPHQELLKREIESDSWLHLLTNVTDMPEFMSWADAAISAGGSTCWELAFMGLPGLIIILADNQRPVGHWLGKSGIGVDLGWHATLSSQRIFKAVSDLSVATEDRKEMAEKGQALVDGKGAARILMLLKAEGLRLRLVRDDDCQLLWRWANDAEVRQASFSTAPIPWEDHVQWFSKKRRDPDCLQFIAVDEQNRPVGQVRFDIQEGERAKIDISIDSERRGLGYGKLILRLATDELFSTTKVKTINSLIKIDNIKSISIFQKANYKRISNLVVIGEQSVHYMKERNDAH